MSKTIENALNTVGRSWMIIIFWPIFIPIGLCLIVVAYLIYWWILLGSWLIIKVDQVVMKERNQ